MKQRKKLPYLALFIDDWMASAKVRKCSETTRGVYTDLLCILHKEPRRGSYSLHDQELKPNNTRSKTQLALAKPSEYQRLPYFAEFLVKRTGSSKAVILKALQELFERKILVIEGDTLIQPRMYRDSGYRLLSDMEENETQEAADGEQENSVEEAEYIYNKKGVEKGTQKSIKKETEKSRARTSRERAHIHNGSGRENNINDSIGNNGGAGGDAPDKLKTKKNNPDGENGVSEGIKVGGVDNLPQEKQKRATKPEKGKKDDSTATAQKKKKQTVADNPPTLEEVQAYFDERAQQGKPFVYVTPDGFYDACCQSGWTLKDGKPMMDWRARVRTFENFRKEHGDKPIGKISPQTIPKPGDPVAVTKPTGKKYNDKW